MANDISYEGGNPNTGKNPHVSMNDMVAVSQKRLPERSGRFSYKAALESGLLRE